LRLIREITITRERVSRLLYWGRMYTYYPSRPRPWVATRIVEEIPPMGRQKVPAIKYNAVSS